MLNTVKDELGVVITIPILGNAMAAGGLLMMPPAHSGQATPLLDELPGPDCVPAIARRTTSPTYGERIASPDLKPTPAAGKRIRAHVTFQEGDREKFKEIIVCHAKRYATAVNLRRGYGIDFPANWQPHLAAPDPWAEPADTKARGNGLAGCRKPGAKSRQATIHGRSRRQADLVHPINSASKTNCYWNIAYDLR